MPTKKTTSLTPQPPVDEPKEGDQIYYWMGKVDTMLGTLVNSVDSFRSSWKENWDDLKTWMKETEQAITRNTASLSDHEKRLLRMEAQDFCQTKDCPIKNYKEDLVAHEKESLTWRWLLEKAYLPITISLLLWFLTVILPRIVVLPGVGP
jgi:hypothetical protein